MCIRDRLADGDLIAAIDLGSNSYHMLVARYVQGQFRVVDRLREMVRMADGLDDRGGLSAGARDRALACLSRFGERIRDIPPQRVSAIATNTAVSYTNLDVYKRQPRDHSPDADSVVAGLPPARPRAADRQLCQYEPR